MRFTDKAKKKFRGLGLLNDRVTDDRDINTEMTDMEYFVAKVWAEAIMTCVMEDHITLADVQKGATPCATCTGDALDANALTGV